MNQLTTQSNEFTQDQISLLKNTFCKGATDDEFKIFAHVCKKTGLDPFVRQIHAVKRPNYATGRDEMTIQTGIDGYRLIAERTGKYSPSKEPSYFYNDKNQLVSSTAYIKKQTVDGTWHEVCATAFFEEYAQRKKTGQLTQFWLKMPHGQLAKCAEALALRKAFPQEMSGIYTTEEMQQASYEELPEDQTKPITVTCEDISSQKCIKPEKNDEKALPLEKIPEFDELCLIHGIVDGSDKMEYINESLKNSKLTKVQFINGIFRKIQFFEKAFDEWMVSKF